MNDPDMMFLRNVVHGAPISETKLALRLQRIDERLNEGRPLDRQINKPFSYYADVARSVRSMQP